MKKMMCSRCGKRPAMFFITKVEGNETKQEGLCMKCAMELNIGPIKQIMESMGISEDEVDSVSEQFDELFGEDGTDEAAGVDFEGDKAKAVTDYLVDLVNNPNFVSDADGSGLSGLRDGSVKAMFSGSWDASAVKEALGDN